DGARRHDARLQSRHGGGRQRDLDGRRARRLARYLHDVLRRRDEHRRSDRAFGPGLGHAGVGTMKFGRPTARMAKLSAAAAALLVAAIAPAGAQEWPTRTISMIVPYAAGGPPDVIARIIAPGMSESLGVQVVVENVSGAGGLTGTSRVARAAPDGYTFLLGAAGVLSQNQTLYKHPPYNSTTDFAPVGLIALTPAILVTRPNFPANDLNEFIAYARANQSKLLFGSGGAGSGGHIACLLLHTAIGVTVTHVP